MNGERMESNEACTCDETVGCFHPCPYAIEIQDADPDEDHCDCCPACEGECALAI